MTNKFLCWLIVLPLLAVGCAKKSQPDPFQPLQKVTISFDKESEFNVAASNYRENRRIESTSVAYSLTQAVQETETYLALLEEQQATPEMTENPVESAPFYAEEIPAQNGPENDSDLDSYFAVTGIEGSGDFDVNKDPNVIPTETDPFGSSFAYVPEPTQLPMVHDPFASEPATEPINDPAPVAQAEPNIIDPFGTNDRGQTTYTLQQGENMTCLARRFNFNLSQFVTLNAFSSASDAGPGDAILLPTNISNWSIYDGSRTVIRHPAIYTVEAGDTFYTIACKFGDVYPEDIATANGKTTGMALTPGQQVTIP